MTVADSAPSWKPSIAAAVLLVARELAPALAADWSVAAILGATGAARSQAYAMQPRVVEACQTLERPAGRPTRDGEDDARFQVACRVRDFLAEHPGAVTGRGERRTYADPFRCFVLDLAAPTGPAAALTVEQLADATGVPLGTLKDWRRMPEPPADETTPAHREEPPAEEPPAGREVELRELAGHPQVATLLDAWQRWEGPDFSAFCRHAREHLRLPWGDTFISRLLQAAGLRDPRRRKRSRPTWNRDTFRRLFPGAQWLGDGTTLAIRINGRWETFNLQATIDVDSNAVVGIHVGDAEDEHAVRTAFEHGEITTGAPPIAITLDGKPCNHTESLAESLDPTVVVPATPARGQAKASLEGAFGLFAQNAPPLIVHGDDQRELARSILALVMTTWFWARNGRPRRRLGGLSPADHYRNAAPSPAEMQAAKDWAAELRRRHERFLETRRRRADRARREILREALQRLGIDDPGDRLATDLARYGINAILNGIATFNAKQDLGTLTGIDDPGRYLAGIIRNLDARDELECTAQRLLELRLRHRDLCLAPLHERVRHVHETVEPPEQPRALLDLALDASRLIDFRFYARATADALERLSPTAACDLYPHLVRRVAASFRVEPERRETLIYTLARTVADLAA